MDTTETTEKVDTGDVTGHKWYIVSSSSGKENSTAKLIKQRIKANNLEDYVTDVVVPTQEKVVIQRGKKKTIEDRIFPGYILVRMLASDEILHILRNTEGVLGFLGMTMNSKKPSALSDKEAKGILEFTQVKQEPIYQTQMSVGDPVKVIEGTWKEFIGTITEINASKGKATVLLSIFDRDTPVELDLLEISKISNT
jgi:transcription termination/antitermination protein NusG